MADPKTKTITEFERTEATDEADYATQKAQKKYFNDEPSKPSNLNAGKNLYESMKNVVKDSMVRSSLVRMENEANYEKTKVKKKPQ